MQRPVRFRAELRRRYSRDRRCSSVKPADHALGFNPPYPLCFHVSAKADGWSMRNHGGQQNHDNNSRYHEGDRHPPLEIRGFAALHNPRAADSQNQKRRGIHEVKAHAFLPIGNRPGETALNALSP
jgi:hypothetical protein